jgi:hypothetical protein
LVSHVPQVGQRIALASDSGVPEPILRTRNVNLTGGKRVRAEAMQIQIDV